MWRGVDVNLSVLVGVVRGGNRPRPRRTHAQGERSAVPPWQALRHDTVGLDEDEPTRKRSMTQPPGRGPVATMAFLSSSRDVDMRKVVSVFVLRRRMISRGPPIRPLDDRSPRSLMQCSSYWCPQAAAASDPTRARAAAAMSTCGQWPTRKKKEEDDDDDGRKERRTTATRISFWKRWQPNTLALRFLFR
jgi:hypothetical protein